jgi:DNA-binding CsgD family transcriptional regulator
MELERLTADAGNVFRSMWAKARRVHALITQGRLSEARQVVDQLGDLARTYDFVMFRYEVQVFSSTLALADGRFEEAESFAEAAHADDDPRFDDIDSSGAYGLQVFMIRREQGRLEEMRPVLQLLGDDTDVGIWQPGLVLALAELDMHHDARPGFEALVDEQLAAVPDDALRPIALAFLSDVCVLLDETETAPLLLAALEPFGGQILAAGFTTAAGPADRFRALLAELDGQSDLADGLLARAHDLAERSGSPVWQTHVRHARGWLAQRRGTRKPTSEFPDGLTAREVAVLAELATGATNKQIGAALHISPNTAANHVRSILQKTGCANRTEAAAYAIQHGLERLHTGTPHSVGP